MFTPIDIQQRREKTLFPFDTSRERFNTVEEIYTYVSNLDLNDVSHEVLRAFPEYLFYDPKIAEFINLYALSKEVGAPAFNGSVNDYPCSYVDFIKMLMTERKLEKEYSDARNR